jgi:transposase
VSAGYIVTLTDKGFVQRLRGNEATITRWLNRYKKGGVTALLEVKYLLSKEFVVKSEAIAFLKSICQLRKS